VLVFFGFYFLGSRPKSVNPAGFKEPGSVKSWVVSGQLVNEAASSDHSVLLIGERYVLDYVCDCYEVFPGHVLPLIGYVSIIPD